MNTELFYINGEWVKPHSAASIELLDPSDESAICRLAVGDSSDVERAIIAAKNAFVDYSRASVKTRLALLERINKGLQEKNDEMAAVISKEMGAPLSLSKSAQAPSGTQHFEEIIRVLEAFEFETFTTAGTLVGLEPVGVCVLITPWNWPINQIATKVAPALAAGCTVVLKPSESAPLNAILFTEILHQAGVPKGVFNLIHGTGEALGDSLTKHPDVDMISFTGSTRAGVAISKNAASGIKRVALELGGKSAGIVCGSPNLKQVAAEAISSCMTNSGQSCNALTRLYVHEDHYDELAQCLASEINQLTIGHSTQDVDIGPLANRAQFEKVREYLELGLSEGARAYAGGLGMPEGLTKGYFVKPTLFTNVKQNMRIAKEEIFGPVLCLLSFNSLEQAINMANDSVYGLSGYVWSHDYAQALDVAKGLRTGMVHINGKGLDSSAPFGGFKQSGNGREWGQYGLHDFLEYKSIYGGKNEQSS